MPAYGKDQVHTLEESRCELTLTDHRIVRIGEKTRIELTGASETGAQVRIASGMAWIHVPPRKKWKKVWAGLFSKRLAVRTPTAVAAIRGTVYRLSCDATYSKFWVYARRIQVTPWKADGEGLEDSTFCVNAGEVFTLVKDFEKYKRRQEEAFKQFREREQEKLEEFERRQREEFEAFQRREEEAFQRFKSLHYALMTFDREKDQQSDWVQWNLQRDALLKR